MISIVLVGIETAGNVGSIARVMKNFGLSAEKAPIRPESRSTWRAGSVTPWRIF